MDKPLLKNNLLVAVIIFIFSVLVYLPSVNNDFVWDDVIEIQKEYHKFKKNSFFQSLIPKTSTKKNKSYYRPFTRLSIYVDYNLWQNNSFGYHLSNIIFNAVSSVLVFFLFLMILKKFNIRARENIALFSALLFTVHPMHVESVSWIAGRTDVLSSMFFLAAFVAHIKSYNKSYYLAPSVSVFLHGTSVQGACSCFPFYNPRI